MRLPPKPEALENAGAPAEPITRDPSYPDRARIDSDVRAFLRPASSPWIVFDRDSRVDDFAKSALRVGAVFASSPNLVSDLGATAAAHAGTTITDLTGKDLTVRPLTDGDGVISSAPAELPLTPTANKMFPESTVAHEPTLEPSTVVFATDVAPAPAPLQMAKSSMPSLTELPEGLRPRPLTRYAAWIAAVAAGVLVVSGGLAASARSTKRVRSVSATAARVHAPPPLVVAPPPPPIEAVPPAAPPAPSATIEIDDPAPAQTAAAAPVVGAEATDPKKRWGKLTIRNDGKVHNVWFDGKRMLGSGTRSFLVFCGMHTVAINDKIDNKDVEIPCNGEYVVSK
jgi:hypothetical protein